MNPLFNVSIVTYLVLRYRAWLNDRRERTSTASAFADLGWLRNELDEIRRGASGRDMLDFLVRTDLEPRIRKLDERIEQARIEAASPGNSGGGFSYRYYPLGPDERGTPPEPSESLPGGNDRPG
jgi:hypothetical protein